MSSITGLDVRKPIGSLFLVLGALLALYGAVSQSARAAHEDIDLRWGLLMMAFGITMLAFGLRNNQRGKPQP